jgi:hypothetical protein
MFVVFAIIDIPTSPGDGHQLGVSSGLNRQCVVIGGIEYLGLGQLATAK